MRTWRGEAEEATGSPDGGLDRLNDFLFLQNSELTTFFVQFSSVQFNSVAKSCPTLCGPMGCSPSVSSVHGILQARILKWVAISSPGAA